MLKLKILYHRILANYHSLLKDSIRKSSECGAKLYRKHSTLHDNHRDIVKKLEGKSMNDESGIEEIENLSVRTYACLKRAGIDTVGQVRKLSLAQVTTIRNIGRKSVEELENKLNIKFM
jgi:DNA-directed RNA polymerase alpha subunit